jgi:C4-dicarboxylate transporter DctM subunit
VIAVVNPALLEFALLLLFLTARVPVGIALGSSALVSMVLLDRQLLDIAALRLYSNLENFLFLAIPLFILTGNVALTGGLADALVGAAFRATRRLSGGMIGQIVPVGMFFAGVTGSSAADVAAMGSFLADPIVQRGFSRALVYATIVITGTLGILLPPSHALIVYSAVAGVSATQLFVAALVPALLLALGMLVIALLRGRSEQVLTAPPSVTRMTPSEWLRLLAAFGLPTILLVGIYGGFLTVSEVGAAAASYTIIVSVVVFGARDRRAFLNALLRSADTSVALLTLIVGAGLFTFGVTRWGVIQDLVALITRAALPLPLVLLMLNVLLLVSGWVMEGLGIFLILVPIMVPMLTQLGMDPLQVGVMVAINIELGVVLPPFGMNLLTLASIREDVQMGGLVRAGLPYLPLVVAFLLLATYWKPLSMWLPSVLH